MKSGAHEYFTIGSDLPEQRKTSIKIMWPFLWISKTNWDMFKLTQKAVWLQVAFLCQDNPSIQLFTFK